MMKPLFFYILSGFAASIILTSCSSSPVKDENVNLDSLKKISSVSEGPDKSYVYKSQLFKIDPLEFKLNKDDLPFQFNEYFLKEKKVKLISMKVSMSESGGKFSSVSDYTWDINENGQVIKETKKSGNKTENSIERLYEEGLLSELNMLNPGERFETSIKKVKYNYANNRLMSVDDILESGDTITTDLLYEGGKVTEKKIADKTGIKGLNKYSYLDGNLIKVEFFTGPEADDSKRSGIYTYTYTKKGKLLYGDHWYPHVSNDSYIFEFDEDDRLKEITYKIFLNKEEIKIPGKTKSYRYEYENGELKKINYFMQATEYTQSGTFEFTYQYY